jgi:hypothetical protein
MKKRPFLMVLCAVCCFFVADIAMAKNSSVSSEQVKENVIAESIASYPGVCACPLTGPETEAPAADAAHGVKREAMLPFVIKMKLRMRW